MSLLVISLMSGISSTPKSARIPADINAIISSVRTYSLNCGELPPPELGFGALITRPPSRADKRWIQIADKIPTDPWNRPYRYVAGDGYPGGFGIYSCGKDGISATQGNDPDDWSSWHDSEDHPDTPARRLMKLSLAGAGLAAVSFLLGAKTAGWSKRKLQTTL